MGATIGSGEKPNPGDFLAECPPGKIGDGGGSSPPSRRGEKTTYEVRAYKIKHGYDVGEFLTAYRNLLQRVIDFIWENIQWAKKTFERHPEYLRDVEENLKRQYGGEELQRIMQTIRDLQTRERLIPRIPKTPEFQCNLRKTLRRDWDYCAHYIDSATRTAYRILKGWRRCYIKGMTNRNKPVIKRKFAKIKKTLYLSHSQRRNTSYLHQAEAAPGLRPLEGLVQTESRRVAAGRADPQGERVDSDLQEAEEG